MDIYIIKRGIKKKFMFLSLLGHGSFARVHLVNKNISHGKTLNRERLYAIKSIRKKKILEDPKLIKSL